MIKVNNVKKYFESGGSTIKAVDGISFTIPTGTLAAILGKSGSGKSTLLALLGALDKPFSGSVEIEDQDLNKLSDSKLTKYRNTKVGFIFQSFNLIPNLSALENVMLPMEFAGLSRRDQRSKAAELLESVGLDKVKQDRRPAKLSGGEQQRVAIARALSNKPKLILADEPTGNLDSATGEVIIKLLSNLAKKENTTVVIVTHDESISQKASQILRIRDGKLASK